MRKWRKQTLCDKQDESLEDKRKEDKEEKQA
jgi:hypothetical protein